MSHDEARREAWRVASVVLARASHSDIWTDRSEGDQERLWAEWDRLVHHLERQSKEHAGE